jgi:hypothetical protein
MGGFTKKKHQPSEDGSQSHDSLESGLRMAKNGSDECKQIWQSLQI